MVKAAELAVIGELWGWVGELAAGDKFAGVKVASHRGDKPRRIEKTKRCTRTQLKQTLDETGNYLFL